MGYSSTFTLTDMHIEMLRNATISWNACEYGAATIDPKRPFGNSNVMADLQEMFPDVDTDTLHKVYHETDTALQIILDTMSFETGDYTNIFKGGEYRWQKNRIV